MKLSRLRSLPLVSAEEELQGLSPVAFERAVRRARVGDEVHLGTLRIAALIARHALESAVAPGGRAAAHGALAVLQDFTLGAATLDVVRKTRSECFAASLEAERRTADAVRTMLASTQRAPHTELDAHADAVMVRQAGLGAHYAQSAVLVVLDGAAEPALLPRVVPQAAGAVAYQTCAFGPARSQDLRAKALQRAAEEVERPFAIADHGTLAVAVQLFHEFLGAYWKDVSDANRVFFGEVIEWALPPALRAS
ncbi:MAG: hypothetical protein R3B13_09235 [Polyangiaceae bacterium]